MGEKNLWSKLGLIILLVGMCIWNIWPPSAKTLRPGIDLGGGHSLTFAIDDSQDKSTDLAERVKNVLKNRIDPNGTMNLIWRPIGHNRLEIQMPLHRTAEDEANQAAYRQAKADILDSNISESQIRALLRLPADAQEEAVQDLIGPYKSRRKLFDRLLAAEKRYEDLTEEFRALRAAGENGASQSDGEESPATQPTTQAITELAREVDDAFHERNEVIEALLDTNLNPRVLEDLLGLERTNDTRAEGIAKIKRAHPDLEPLIDKMISSYDEYAGSQGYLDDPSDLMRLLQGAGVLEFRILPVRQGDQIRAADFPEVEKSVAYYVDNLQKYGPGRQVEVFEWLEISNPDMRDWPRDYYVIADYADRPYVLTYATEGMGLYETDEGWSLKRAQESRDSSGRIAISFELGGRGPSLFGEVTRNNLNEPLAIVLDDQIISSANIESPIYGQGQITGVFTREYVNYIVRTLEAGALPAKLKETPLQQRSVAPTLGVTNQQRGLHAVTIAFVATIIFMAIYYGYNGVIADIALLMNLVITLGVMSFIQATFTLPGVAGLVLMLGMAVDANVLIYERIREELQRGVSVRMAVKLGYEKAFSAILDSNVTTILTAVILGSIGSEEIKGFGLTLGIGLVTSMFTALFVTRQFFHTMTPESLNKEEVRRVSVGTVVLVAAAAIIMGSGYLAVDPDFRADSAWFGLGEFISWMAGTAVVLVLALVVFRLVYGATGHRRANKLPMLRLFSAPKIQWMSKYRIFWTVSAVILILGFVFEAAVPSAQYLDIEFVGGTSVQVEVDDQHEAMFEEAGDQRLLSYIANEDRTENDPSTSVEWLESAAAAIEKVEVESAGELSYRVEIPGDYTPAQTEALLMPSFEDAVRLGGIKPADEGGITLTMKTGTEDNPAPSLEDARKMVEAATEYARAAAGKLGAARVQAVSEELAGGEIRQAFEIVTTETHTSLVSQALLASMGDILEVTQPIDAQLVKPAGHPDGIVPVPQSAERLSDVLPADLVGSAGLAALDEFKGGVVFVFENLEPAQTENDIQVRLKDMRLQPDFEQLAARPTKAIGLVQADASAEAGDEQDEPLFSRMAIVVSDPQYMYVAGEENDSWRAELAQAELELAQTALASSQSLQRVTQFAPQIAQEATTKAVIAIVLSLIAIAAYLWVRFGSVQFGLAGIIALYHDVAITLSAVMACHYLHNTFIGELLGLQDFRIDLAMIAAFLTIVGYSINDSIVIFDRIRENRGRLATVSEGLINDSINQTLSRTLITSLTTLTAVVVMYVVGGEGIHGFAFAMIVGSISGTYSTIAIATPMLAHPRAMWVVATILATITILAILSAVPFPAVKLVLMAIVLAGAAWMLVKQLKATAGGATATAGA